jgi:dynein heavy chain
VTDKGTFAFSVKASMESIENRYNEVTRLYLLLEQYTVPVVPTDIALYQTLGPTLRQFKEVVDMAEDTKEENISKFSIELEKNIAELVSDVIKLRDRAQDPMIYNPNAKVDTVLRFLDDLIKQIDKLGAMADNYTKYQNNFKVLPYKYVELEETKSEIQLKRTLWLSFQKWEAAVEKWKFMPFDTLNTDEMNAEIQGYLKTIYVLDKGLPANDVLPKLKSMVDEYRVIYPTIVDLRNNALKQRHWDKIQDAIGRALVRDETFTLARLMESKVFDFKEEVSTVSSQASSEAALEELLNKVAKVWAEVEFAVLPYRDSKVGYAPFCAEKLHNANTFKLGRLYSGRSRRYSNPVGRQSGDHCFSENVSLYWTNQVGRGALGP